MKVHDALLESTSSKPYEESSSQVPEGSGNLNPTASAFNPPADQMETLTVESLISTVSLPVLTACLNDSLEPSSEARLVSKRVANQEETPSLDNILSLTNRFDDILGVSTRSDEIIRVKANIIGPVDTPIQTRHKSNMVAEQSFMATIHQKTDPALLQFCLYSCFLSQVEPKKVSDALQDPSWVEAMQEELLQFKFRKFGLWLIVLKGLDLLGQNGFSRTRRMKGELWSEISDFLYGTIDEEVYVMQPPGFHDPVFPVKVYKVEKAMYGLHQAPRAWYGTLSKYLLKNSFQRGTIDQTLFIRRQREDFILVQEEDGIFLSQDKYIGDILKKFGFSDGYPKLGLWYPKAPPFDLVAYSNSDYGRASQDRKYTTGGSQFLERRLISWQCKKQTIVATSTIEAEYVAAASCCGQVLWIQNQ
nr:hypothetical protein [Tanacetum cinerariifolium]